jgi:acyl-CoA synthetase (NDP forming)
MTGRKMAAPIAFASIDPIFARAERDGRSFLFEHEVYALLRAAGIGVPKTLFVRSGRKVSSRDLAGFAGSEVVLKIVSPLIQHKTDVGGVVFAKRSAAAVNAAIRGMVSDVLGRFEKPAVEDVARSLCGILVCEKVDFDKFGFGTELLVGVRTTREFGPVVTFGAGGVEVEYLNARIKDRQAVAIASAHLLKQKNVPALVAGLAVYDKLVKPFRGREAVLRPEELSVTLLRLALLAARYSPFGRSRYVIEEMEVNPFVVRGGKLVPLDGLCRFSRARVDISGRPFAEIGRLLHPSSIAVIGVSEKMNLGRIILNNILKMGFPREKVTVVKPGLDRIEGCVCVPDVASLPETVDLFVLTLGADMCADVMAQLIGSEKARSAIIIAGGMGEKQGGAGVEDKIAGLIAAGRARKAVTPVVNGGNCLGIYSKPGRYDTTFIPEHKLSFPKTEGSNLAYVSQSGAFLVSRVSKLQRIEPLYGISLGNQIDLRISDYLRYLESVPEVKVFAVYIEGFKPGDGFLAAEAAACILRDPSRHVIVYKSGRTPEGRQATSGHTASVAGDYAVSRSILEAAGCIVADSIADFDDLIRSTAGLAAKAVRGNRVGLLSNAGFESVVMADNLRNGDSLVLAPFAAATRAALSAALAPLGIDKLQDIKNPLDVTPVADDGVFCACAGAILADRNVDCAVISPVPMTPAMKTLAPGPGYAESIYDPASVSSRLVGIFRASAKPFVVNIDAGTPYDAMADQLEAAGVPVFRRVDEAVRFLRMFVAGCLRRGALSRRRGI